MSVTESALPGIEADRVERWLAGHVDGWDAPVEFGLVSGGRSNLTYRVTDAAGAAYALRRPPTGGVLSTAHDVSREWRFISALAPTAVPVAAPVAYCADATVTGAEFYVMEFVKGLVLADREAGLALESQARDGAAGHLVDALVALHALDPVAVGLGDMVRRTGMSRAGSCAAGTRRCTRRAHRSLRCSTNEVHDLLARRIPAQSGRIVHGDDPAGDAGHPRAGRRGPGGLRLGSSRPPATRWPTSGTWPRAGRTRVSRCRRPRRGRAPWPASPARAQLVQRYAPGSGRDVSDLPYWVAFSRWRSACIGVGVRAGYLAGHMADDGFAATLLAPAEPGTAGSRVILAEAARDALLAAQ